MSESELLLPHTRSRASTIGSVTASVRRKAKSLFRKRFFWFCFLGVIAIIILNLSFLPRTSLNRDFRRWHDLHLTKTDAKRILLAHLKRGRPDDSGFAPEARIEHRLRELSNIVANRSENIAYSGSPELSHYIESSFRLLGFSVDTFDYDLDDSLRSPVSSLLQLVHGNTVIYESSLLEENYSTPAFFNFATLGSVDAPFVYAKRGHPEDIDRLLENHVIKGKIVIIEYSQNDTYDLSDTVDYLISLQCAGVVVSSDMILRLYKPLHPHTAGFCLPVNAEVLRELRNHLDLPKREGGLHIDNIPDSTARFPLNLEALEPHLRLRSTFAKPFTGRNIVASLPGALNDGEIVIGASRDTLTSANPLSGHAIMLEVMATMRRLWRLGWRPLRTIKFVSWDASRAGALGAAEALLDSEMFPANMPILAYIDLHDDTVVGDRFSVVLNPLLNHIIEDTTRFIPFPKNNTGGSVDDGNDNNGNDDDDLDDDETTLHRLWRLQSGNYIENNLGYLLQGSNGGKLQINRTTPTVHVQYAGRANSTFLPELNGYSFDWVSKIDPHFELHGLLVRFVGLLSVSLCEHEVVDVRVFEYFAAIRRFFEELLTKHRDILLTWRSNLVDERKFGHSKLWEDSGLLAPTFGDLLSQFVTTLHQCTRKGEKLDEYNMDVQDSLTRDYPWYRMLVKLRIYAQFKVTNYRMLRLEKDLAPDDGHFIYGEVPRAGKPLLREEKLLRGAFTKLHRLVDEGNMDGFMEALVERYDRLAGVERHM